MPVFCGKGPSAAARTKPSRAARLLPLLLIISLAACAPNKDRLDYWLGRPSAELLADWGPPEASETLPNGHQALRWSGEFEVEVPPRTCRPQDSRCNPGGYAAIIERITIVETDPQGRILRLQFQYPAGEPRRRPL